MTRGLVIGLATTLVAVLAVLLVLIQTRPQPVQGSELERALATVDAHVELPADAVVTRVELDEGRLHTVLAASGEDRLRIRVTEGLDQDAAEARVDDLRAVIDNLFGDRQAPYPGQLSHTLQCPPRFQPEELPRGRSAMAVIALYANDRLAFGGCSEDLLRYHATVGFFYDDTRDRLFQVEYFASVEDEDDRGSQVVGSFTTTEGAR